MPPVRWTTSEQTAFLEERKPEYLKSKKDDTSAHFYSKLFKDWFDCWPVLLGLDTTPSVDTLNADTSGATETTTPTTSAATELQKTKDAVDLAELISSRKHQLKTWYYWHTKDHSMYASRQSNKRPHHSSTHTKPSRTLHELEVFQKLHNDKIKPHLTVGKLSRADRMAEMRRVRKMVYEEQPEEIKEEVRAEVAKRAAERAGEGNEKEAIDIMDRIQKYQKEFVHAISHEMTYWNEQTGYNISVYFGGRNVLCGGEIHIGSLHLGETDVGNRFDTAYRAHESAVIMPFTKHVKDCNPEHLRKYDYGPCTDLLLDRGESSIPPPSVHHASRSTVDQTTYQSADNAPPSRVTSVTPDPPQSPLIGAPSPTSYDSPQFDDDVFPPPASRAQTPTPSLLDNNVPSPVSDHVHSPTSAGGTTIPTTTPTRALGANSAATNVNGTAPALSPPFAPGKENRPPGTTDPINRVASTSSPSVVTEKDHPRRIMTPVQSTVWSSSSSTSSTRDTNVTPKANADAPTWFKEALDHFLEEPLGDAWLNCVGKYVELEKSIMYGVGETQRLSTAGRPGELAYWMKRACNYSSPPPIKDLGAFECQFVSWLAQMKANSVEKDKMKVGGINGFLSVMLLLCWWGREVVAMSTPSGWADSVQNVLGHLERMLSWPIKRKLASPETNDDNAHAKRRKTSRK